MPYTAPWIKMWSPEFSSVRRVLLIADMPLLRTKADSAPSNLASFSPRACGVRLGGGGVGGGRGFSKADEKGPAG